MSAIPREMPKGAEGIDPMAEKKEAAPLAYHVLSRMEAGSMLNGAGVGGAQVGGAVDVVVMATVVVVATVEKFVTSVKDDVVSNVIVVVVDVEETMLVELVAFVVWALTVTPTINDENNNNNNTIKKNLENRGNIFSFSVWIFDFFFVLKVKFPNKHFLGFCSLRTNK